MAVQWLTIGSLTGPAARRLWEGAGSARKIRDQDDEVPISIWNQTLAPILTAIDRHADQPPVWSYHRSLDPWQMGDSMWAPFSDLPVRQRRVIYCQRGPESLYLAYRTDWSLWLGQLGRQQQKLSKRDMGHREKALMLHKLRDACQWCQVLGTKIPAAVFLRRTCLRASSDDAELSALADKSPAWLAEMPTI